MRALMDHKQGKQNDRLYIRSNKRKQSKSPIKFQQKIKELEQQIHKQTKKKSLTKDKPHTARIIQHQQPTLIPARSPIIPKASKSKEQHQKINPKINKLTSSSTKQFAKTQPIQSKTTQNNFQKPFYWGKGGVKISQKTSLKSNDQQFITQLKQQNLRYKDIYSKSLQKMQSLQTRLASIQQEHHIENGALEHTLRNLKKQVQEKKKHNIVHVFSYKEQQFIVIKDRVIAQSENQNSSAAFQNMEHDKSSLSYLSLQSKQIY